MREVSSSDILVETRPSQLGYTIPVWAEKFELVHIRIVLVKQFWMYNGIPGTFVYRNSYLVPCECLKALPSFPLQALERATEGKVRGAPHRVRRGDHGPRHCFIYEQKYADFFPPASID